MILRIRAARAADSRPAPRLNEEARMSVELIILDCDGVMIDSRAANIAYYNRVMDYCGRRRLTPLEEEWAHTLPDREVLARLLPGREDCRRRLPADFKYGNYQEYNHLLKPEPSLPPFMKWFKSGGGRLAVCTNRTRPDLELVLNLFGWLGWFDFAATADQVTRPKPHPEPVRLILHHLQTSPARCLYVGDSLADQEAAQGAAVPFVAFRAAGLQAETHINNFEDLKKLLEYSGV